MFIEPTVTEITPRFRQYVKERNFLLRDYAALGLEKVLVTSGHGCRRKVTACSGTIYKYAWDISYVYGDIPY